MKIKFIGELHQHGHIEHFKNVAKIRDPPKPEDPGPQVLTMYILSAGFIVWLASISTAFIAFAGEHLWRCYKVTSHLKKRVRIKLGNEDCECIE